MSPLPVPQAFALALEHHQAGCLDEAGALYRQILAVQPKHADAWHFLGVIAQQAGQYDLAVERIQRALALRPNNPVAYSNLGEAYRGQGRLEEAIASFRRALELEPAYPEAHNNLGNALREHRQLDEAIACCRRALELKPDYAEACNNLGIALGRRGQVDEAIASYRRALQLRPDYPAAWLNLGGAWAEQSQFGEAVAAYRRALELQPDYAEAQSNLGLALREQGRIDEAMAACRRAPELQPDYALVKSNYALLLLLRGDFAGGWPLYEARSGGFQSSERRFPQPRWDGRTLGGRRVLIHVEQGLGDSIQFIRYAGLVAARGGEVVVECQRPLAGLFRGVKGVSEVVAAGDPLPPSDLHVPMLSQPWIFQTTRESIPREIPYLFAEPARCEIWRKRLGAAWPRLRVGLAWMGNTQSIPLRKRHVPLHKLLPLLALEDIDFFCLQIDEGAEQLRQLPAAAGIFDHTKHIEDFADTAAFMGELDLIISVDTAVAHLAGALGRPVWTLLPFVPDWRWGLESETTPWYPTMQLFRQPALGDWDSVIRRVAEELSRKVVER